MSGCATSVWRSPRLDDCNRSTSTHHTPLARPSVCTNGGEVSALAFPSFTTREVDEVDLAVCQTSQRIRSPAEAPWQQQTNARGGGRDGSWLMAAACLRIGSSPPSPSAPSSLGSCRKESPLGRRPSWRLLHPLPTSSTHQVSPRPRLFCACCLWILQFALFKGTCQSCLGRGFAHPSWPHIQYSHGMFSGIVFVVAVCHWSLFSLFECFRLTEHTTWLGCMNHLKN